VILRLADKKSRMIDVIFFVALADLSSACAVVVCPDPEVIYICLRQCNLDIFEVSRIKTGGSFDTTQEYSSILWVAIVESNQDDIRSKYSTAVADTYSKGDFISAQYCSYEGCR
jgi:hypothetical protein